VTIVPSIGDGLPGGPFPITGSGTCNTTTRQNFVGYQFGHDIAKLNIGGANWHFGVTAGYLEANAKDVSSPLPDPSFSGNFQVPFAGAYMTLTKGGFFADAQARWEFYQSRVSDAQNFLLGQKFDARGFSLTGNVGYNQPLGSGWFIEPSAGVVWSLVKVDPLNVAGPDVPFSFFPLAGTVQMDDVESLLGRASLRIGANIAQGNITWQPFFTASVFHELAGDVTTTLTPGPAPLFNPLGLAPATLTTTRVGTYAQLGLGTAAVFGNTGWLGYGRVDYRTGENMEGMSASAGLRYQFMPVQSDATVKYTAGQITSHTYDWTGPYIGAFAGMTWGDQSQFTPAFDTHDHPRFAGYLGGGQVGYNVQTGRWVLGVEGDYGLTNATGGKSCVGGSDAFLFTCEGEVAHRLASLTARLGYTWGRALLYAKGGVAAGEVTVQISDNTGGLLLFPPVTGTTKWLTGWTVGGGIEFALTDKWSAKAEYMHYDLGAGNFPIDVGAAVVNAHTWGDVVRIGVNYHFQK
jgi:opacity protein-like surface antigen